MHPDVSAIAGVILLDGRAVASIGIAGPTQRMIGKLPAATRSVRAMCNDLAARLEPSGH
jgi:DNA-binding IclR family transcriptional regulator